MRLPPTRATSFIAAVTAASWALVAIAGVDVQAWSIGGFIPARLAGYAEPSALPVWITPLTTTLLHGGIIHLAFNMLMLVFCGRMVEAVVGPAGLAILYVLGAYAAAAAQYFADPLDASPMIGASGAISAIFGAYALLYGRPRGFANHPRLGAAVNIMWLAAAWVGVQFLMGLAFADFGLAIATAAHVGGFIAGLALLRPLMMVRHRTA
jgi:membrane associated rhomboid family serine protease